jgi:hypothetical protein
MYSNPQPAHYVDFSVAEFVCCRFFPLFSDIDARLELLGAKRFVHPRVALINSITPSPPTSKSAKN